MTHQKHKQVPLEIQLLEAKVQELQAENAILQSGYVQLLSVSAELLRDMPQVWADWHLENVYRYQLTADVYSQLEAQICAQVTS